MPGAPLTTAENEKAFKLFDRVIDENDEVIAHAIGDSAKRHRLADVVVWVADPTEQAERDLFGDLRDHKDVRALKEPLEERWLRLGIRPALVVGLLRSRAASIAEQIADDVAERLREPPEVVGHFWCIGYLDGVLLLRTLLYVPLSRGGAA
jgi:hypothetical protein